MSDAAFIAALEGCSLPAAEFTHAAHVRMAYLYLRAGSFGAAIDRSAATIRRYAASLGKDTLYHDTITVAYVALIRRHLCERGDGGGWPGFAAANPELFEPRLLDHYFPAGQLATPLARQVFVLPAAVAAA